MSSWLPKIREFTKNLNLKFKYRDPLSTWGWDGENIATNNKASNIVHDVAHWLVCSKNRRRLPDFGLSQGPDSGISISRIVTYKKERKEEARASLLGILIERKLGMRWKETLIEHTWQKSDGSFKGFMTKTLAWLYSKGLIDRTLRPIVPPRLPKRQIEDVSFLSDLLYKSEKGLK